MTARVPDAVYYKIAQDCIENLFKKVDMDGMTSAAWARFMQDAFDMTDELVSELERRLAARQAEAPQGEQT